MKSKYIETYFSKIREDFASDEELEVYCWLKEAEAYNLVSDIEYQPVSYQLCDRASVQIEKQLKTKIKIVDKFLFHPHVYTADYEFEITPAIYDVFVAPVFAPNSPVVIDVKGSFNPYGDPKQFSINQKLVWEKFEVYVEKIVPEKLFKKSYVPEICRLTPKRREPVKKYIGVPVIGQFVDNLK